MNTPLNQVEKENASAEQILQWLESIKELDAFWKSRADQIYERKLSLTDPIIVRINHLRQAFRFYLIPAFEQALATSFDQQAQFLKYMMPFTSHATLYQFLDHFYAIHWDDQENHQFCERDLFEQDVFLLYDLYKAKKTFEAVEALLSVVQSPEVTFPSVFTPEQQIRILKGFRAALLMTFKQSLKAEHHSSLFQKIDASYIHPEQLEERKRHNIIFARPSTDQGSPYRRIFLHTLFRKQLKTRIKKQETVIRFSMVEFEQLKHEYLTHWTQQLGNHPKKMEAYQKLSFQNKTFAEWLIEDPTIEEQLLGDLPAKAFDELVDDLQETVEPEKRPKVEPLSDNSPVFKQLNSNFQGFLNKFRSTLLTPQPNTLMKSVLQTLDRYSDLSKQMVLPVETPMVACLPPTTNDPKTYRKATLPVAEHDLILILMPSFLWKQYETPLNKRFSNLTQPIQIMTPDTVLKSTLESSRLIVLLQCRLPKKDKLEAPIDPKALSAEIINAELPLQSYSVANCSHSSLEKDLTKRFNELKKMIQEGEADPILLEKYNRISQWCSLNEDSEILAKTLEQLKLDNQPLLEQYHTLLFWLIVEALEAAGHSHQLIHALLKVSRCLVIDNEDQQVLSYLSSVGFNPSLLASWDSQYYQKKRQDRQPSSGSMTIEAFLKQSEFDKYDVVLVTDWHHGTAEQFPVYLRIRQYQSEKHSDSAVQIYAINLFQIFDEQHPFWDICMQRLQKLRGMASSLQRLPQSLFLFLKHQKNYIKLKRKQALRQNQICQITQDLKALPEERVAFNFLKHFQHYLLNRVEFFVLGHVLNTANPQSNLLF